MKFNDDNKVHASKLMRMIVDEQANEAKTFYEQLSPRDRVAAWALLTEGTQKMKSLHVLVHKTLGKLALEAFKSPELKEVDESEQTVSERSEQS